jgi:hypothetical protein
MSDGTNGSAMLAGNPAGDAAAGNAGANAPSSNNTITATADLGGVNNQASNAAGNWWDGFQDNDLKGYVQNKGWKDPADLAVGYKNLEKLLGAEKIPMPKGADDAEGWTRVYDALGRPKSADEYKLSVPEGDTGEFAKLAAGKFHELGLTAKQAEGLAAWYNEQGSGRMNEMQQQQAAKAEADMQSLKQEWGGAFDENVEFGRRAAREYGLNAEKLSALENSLGTSEMLKLMATIGRAQGESEFVTSGSGNTFGMTPSAAQQRITALRADKTWTAKYISGDADARSEMQRLMNLAYPE